MRIGDIEIAPLVDGELVVPANAFYPDIAADDWAPYAEMLEPTFGEAAHLCTLGGYLVRDGDRLIVVDTGIGPHPKYRSSAAASAPRSSRPAWPAPRLAEEKERVQQLREAGVFERVLVRRDGTGAYLVAVAESAEALHRHLAMLPFVQDSIMTMHLDEVDPLPDSTERTTR